MLLILVHSHLTKIRDYFHNMSIALLLMLLFMILILQWSHHYVRTHAVTETCAIATFRNFARSHPLYKLLRPHLRTSVRITTSGRAELLPPFTPANLTVAICKLNEF